MKRLYFVNRRKGRGKSIEMIFDQLHFRIQQKLQYVESLEVPATGVSFRSIWKNTRFVSKLKGIVHVTGDIHYTCIWPFGTKVLTVHDIGLVRQGGTFSRFFKKLLWLWIPSLTVKRITVVSEFTRQDLLLYIPWASSKVMVIPNPIGEAFRFHPKDFEKECPVILHIGTNEHKNLLRTISSIVGIKCKLVVVGVLNPSQKDHLEISGIHYENRYDLTNDEIAALYREADIISFISLFEGFGMPIIEANKTGRVVITSKCGSIPEVAGNAAHYVDPLNLEEIREGFLRVIEDDVYRQELIDNGLINVKRFDAEQIVNQYIELYKQLGLNG